MTTTTVPDAQTGTIERRYAGPVEVGDGRTIVGLCAPYDRVATVSDGGLPYQEVIRNGAFRRSTKAPHRTLLNYEHRTDLGNVIGPATELVERDDGLYGTFRVLPGALGDHALEVIRSGACTGLSVSAALHPQGSRLVDGVVERNLLILDHVAVTASPAYDGAEVIALRSGQVLQAQGIRAALATNAALRARFTR